VPQSVNYQENSQHLKGSDIYDNRCCYTKGDKHCSRPVFHTTHNKEHKKNHNINPKCEKKEKKSDFFHMDNKLTLLSQYEKES
jgi:hypothetical protein